MSGYRRPPWAREHLVLVWSQLGMNERRCLRTMGELGGKQALDTLVEMELLTKEGARTPKGQAVLKEGGR